MEEEEQEEENIFIHRYRQKREEYCPPEDTDWPQRNNINIVGNPQLLIVNVRRSGWVPSSPKEICVFKRLMTVVKINVIIKPSKEFPLSPLLGHEYCPSMSI